MYAEQKDDEGRCSRGDAVDSQETDLPQSPRQTA